MDNERQAIGGTSQLGTTTDTGQPTINYGVMPEQVQQQLTPGTEFVVIAKTRQGEPLTVWTSGDQEQTQQLFRDAYTGLAFERTSERQPAHVS